MAGRAVRKRPSPTANSAASAVRLVKVTITLDDHDKTVTINPKKLPLVFLEALEELNEDNSWRNMRVGIQQLLKLTDDEALQLDTDNMLQIANAITGATDIPND